MREMTPPRARDGSALHQRPRGQEHNRYGSGCRVWSQCSQGGVGQAQAGKLRSVGAVALGIAGEPDFGFRRRRGAGRCGAGLLGRSGASLMGVWACWTHCCKVGFAARCEQGTHQTHSHGSQRAP